MTPEPDDLFASAPTWGLRGRALLKLLTFGGVCVVGLIFAIVPMVMAGLNLADDPVAPLWRELVLETPTLFALLCGGGAAWLIWREPLGVFGLGGAGHRRRDLGLGFGAGLGLLSALILLLWSLGLARFGPLAPAGSAFDDGLLSIIVFAGVAIAEEGFFRGYALVQLSRVISVWPAMIVTTLGFTAIHLANPGETPVGILHVAVYGLVAAYSVKRSGALWFALGYHCAWDFAQSFLFGVPDSGTLQSGVLVRCVLQGPAGLTGGPAGPEGSWLSLAAEALMLAIIYFAFGKRRKGPGLTSRPR